VLRVWFWPSNQRLRSNLAAQSPIHHSVVRSYRRGPSPNAKLSGIIPEQVSDIIQESVSVLGKNMQFGGKAADPRQAGMANILDCVGSGTFRSPPYSLGIRQMSNV
jgi:hypothetical protein